MWQYHDLKRFHRVFREACATAGERDIQGICQALSKEIKRIRAPGGVPGAEAGDYLAGIKLCKLCGVPFLVGKAHAWNPDGTITQKRDPEHRMVFFDSDGLDILFSNIEKLIGVPIEKIVIESKARATTDYIKRLIRGPKGNLVRFVGVDRIIGKVVDQGRAMGYGNIRILEYSWKEARMVLEVRDPYCLPMFCGDMKGANAAFRGIPGTISCEETGPGTYLVTNFAQPHAPELADRLLARPRPRKPGNISLERCTGCGAPRELSRFVWDLERGTITHPDAGFRLAVFGPAGLEAIFDELEKELGESIPAAVVEAQRMHVENRMTGFGEGTETDDIGQLLAIQGLGNVVSFEPEEGGFTARVENPALPLLVVGMAHGFSRAMTGADTSVEWELADDGDLLIRVVG